MGCKAHCALPIHGSRSIQSCYSVGDVYIWNTFIVKPSPIWYLILYFKAHGPYFHLREEIYLHLLRPTSLLLILWFINSRLVPLLFPDERICSMTGYKAKNIQRVNLRLSSSFSSHRWKDVVGIIVKVTFVVELHHLKQQHRTNEAQVSYKTKTFLATTPAGVDYEAD